jgi:hypothetical protein
VIKLSNASVALVFTYQIISVSDCSRFYCVHYPDESLMQAQLSYTTCVLYL